jgi:hypothetical protein
MNDHKELALISLRLSPSNAQVHATLYLAECVLAASKNIVIAIQFKETDATH